MNLYWFVEYISTKKPGHKAPVFVNCNKFNPLIR